MNIKLKRLFKRDRFVIPPRAEWPQWASNARGAFEELWTGATHARCIACGQNPAGPLARAIVDCSLRHPGKALPYAIGVASVWGSCALGLSEQRLLEMVELSANDLGAEEMPSLREMLEAVQAHDEQQAQAPSSFEEAASNSLNILEFTDRDELAELAHRAVRDFMLSLEPRATDRLKRYLSATGFGILRDNKNNATVVEQDGRYYVGINYGLLRGVHDVLCRWVADPALFSWLESFWGRDNAERRQMFLRSSFVNAVRWIWTHEFTHIYGGHLDYLKRHGLPGHDVSLDERDVDRRIPRELLRAMEADADRLAVRFTAHADWLALEDFGKLEELGPRMDSFMTGAAAVMVGHLKMQHIRIQQYDS